MDKIFLTKVWGFDPEEYPVLGFNTDGGRRKFLRESKPGDWLAIAGTRTDPTPPQYRGRLLGKVQLGAEEVDVVEVLRSVGTEIPDSHYAAGRYRWPFGLPMISAFRFPALPDLSELFGSYLPGKKWASFAIDLAEELGSQAALRVDALESTQATIVKAPAIERQREKQRSLMLSRSQTGPPPSGTRRGSSRILGCGYAYLFELEGGQEEVFKIGCSKNAEERLKSLNDGILPELTGFRWKLTQSQAFATEKAAFDFEQAIHDRLAMHRVDGRQEIYQLSRGEVLAVWQRVFADAEWV